MCVQQYQIISDAYRFSRIEKALRFTGNVVGGTKQNVFAHWLQQIVSSVAFVSAVAIKYDVNAFW